MKKLLQGKIILLADDEEMLRECINDLFTSRGATVIEAKNGVQAFELLKKNRVDIVFSDVRMPGGDGITLIRQIHNSLHYKPAVFLCTGFMDITIEEAIALGVLRVFQKPFSSDEIIQVVAAAVADRDLQKD